MAKFHGDVLSMPVRHGALQKLDAIAQERGISRAALVRRTIEEALGVNLGTVRHKCAPLELSPENEEAANE
jgi:hypothetical protein